MGEVRALGAGRLHAGARAHRQPDGESHALPEPALRHAPGTSTPGHAARRLAERARRESVGAREDLQGAHRLRQGRTRASSTSLRPARAAARTWPGELLNLEAGIKTVHIPYKGLAPAVSDLLGGQVQMMFAGISTVIQHVKAGKLVALAIASPQRNAAASRRADRRRERPARLRRHLVVRHRRALGHAARDRRQDPARHGRGAAHGRRAARSSRRSGSSRSATRRQQFASVIEAETHEVGRYRAEGGHQAPAVSAMSRDRPHLPQRPRRRAAGAHRRRDPRRRRSGAARRRAAARR